MDHIDPALESLRAQIREQSATDPHIAAKIAAQAILEKIFAVLNDGKGVHAESALALLGSLAGQACLQEAFAHLTTEAGRDVVGAIMTVADTEGRTYYYGDPINRPLLEDRYSVWSLLAGTLQAYGAKLPDIQDIITHVTASIGKPAFGIPRLPANRQIRFQPRECLQLWQPLKTEIIDILPVPANDWHLAYALAIQNLIEQAKGTLSPAEAGIIVMECDVPMSKISE